MDVPLSISFHGVDRSPAAETLIREKVDWLVKFFHHINSCHVTVEVPHQHSRKGKIYHVKIDIGLPGLHDVVISHEREEDQTREHISAAINDAFDKARRRLQDMGAKMSGDVKTHRP